jgi:hypothetical protein
MATGDSGNYAGSLLEVIEAEAILKFSEASVSVPLVKQKSEPKADQITFVAYNAGSNKVTSADVDATAEGTVTPSTALDSEKKTITLDMYSVMLPIYDEAKLSNADDVYANAGALAGNAMASKLDSLVNALYDGFSNAVGANNSALTVDNLFDALSSLKQNSAPGQPHAVLEPRQIWGTYGVHNDLVTSAQFAGAGIQDEGARNGFVSKIAGIDMYSSPEFTITDNDGGSSGTASSVKGGIFVSEAIGFGYAGEMMRVEEYREGSFLRSNIVVSSFCGATEIIDGYGVEVLSQIIA